MIRREINHGGPKPTQTTNNHHIFDAYPKFCNECGSKLIWTPVNEVDDSVELVCPGCGLVHSPIINREELGL